MKWPQIMIVMLLLSFFTTSAAKSTALEENIQTSGKNPPLSEEKKPQISGKKVTKIPPPNKTKKLQKDSNKADSYQASEEISEDLSVSYPVDI